MLNADDYRRMKSRIDENFHAAFASYCRENGCETMFLDPQITYFDAKSDIFDKLAEKGISEPMKRIYRAGKTLIMFAVPYSDEVMESNREGDAPSELWLQAYQISNGLMMKLNSSIKAALKEWGRVTSSLNTPMDWNMSKAKENWSHRTAGAIAGLGTLTAAGLFIDRSGRFARVSGVVSDVHLIERYEGDTDILLEKVLHVRMTESEMKHCPCGAVTPGGFDRFRCQEYCTKFNERVPSPEVCGKCIRKTENVLRHGREDLEAGNAMDVADLAGIVISSL